MKKTPIIAVVGKRGMGKTLLMTWLLWHYAKQSGLPVYSNYSLKLPGVECKKMSKEFMRTFFETKGEAFLKMNGGLLAIDEFTLFLDAYDFRSKAAKLFSYFVLQTRKRNVSLFYTVQQMNLVPLRMRNNTDLIIEPYYNDGDDFIQYDIFDYEAPFKEFKKTLIVKNIKQVFDMYDSTEIIDTMDAGDE